VVSGEPWVIAFTRSVGQHLLPSAWDRPSTGSGCAPEERMMVYRDCGTRQLVDDHVPVAALPG